jgi:hypothetical protein
MRAPPRSHLDPLGAGAARDQLEGREQIGIRGDDEGDVVVVLEERRPNEVNGQLDVDP